MALRTLDAPRDLVGRILETPDLARVVQSLEPAVLQQLVERCGLEDCGPIVALATTEQLLRVFDEDLWRSERVGSEERLDVERFALWLEVLAEAGVDVAARRLVELDFDFVTAALSRQLLVLDAGAMTIETLFAEMSDDRELGEAALARMEAALEDAPSLELGGFRLIARRGDAWDALAAILVSLHDSHHAFFGQLLARCRAFSAEYIDDNGGLYQVLTTNEQVLDDAASDREARRERDGYVDPPLAASFLKVAREPVLIAGEPPRPDQATARYFRSLEERGLNRSPPEKARDVRTEKHAAGPTERHVHELLATLQDEGVLPRSRAALPPAPSDSGAGHARIRAFLEQERSPADQARCSEELGYLANVLVAGCAFQSRRFRPVEAADAVLAACALGLEYWPRQWPEARDLVTVFRVGWRVAHEQVCLHAATRLVEIVPALECDDPHVRPQLDSLARRMAAQLKAGTPWRARDELDVLAILDPPSWATLLGLVDECPVVPKAAATGTGRPALRVTAEFEFISDSTQIARVRDFVESLPRRLAGSPTQPRRRGAPAERSAAATSRPSAASRTARSPRGGPA
jgi:hypothetical protein